MDDRLPTSGMTVREVLARAEAWWDATGRHVMGREFNRLRGTARTAKGIIIPGEATQDLPSNILNGEPWAALNTRERAEVAKWWHRFFVVAKHVEDPADSGADRDTIRRMRLQ